MKAFIIGFVAVVVLGGGGYLAFHKSAKPAVNTSGQANVQQVAQAPAAAAATITYTDNGFSPAKTTVNSGDTVAIKNDSSNVMQFDSDPHPQHTDDLDLNVGTVDPGQTVTFKVTKKGTFGFHDHLNAENTGTIVVN